MIPPEHVLITGAAGAIGSAVARRMRASWPTTRLALLDRTPEPMEDLARDLGNATVHGTDLRNVDSLPAVVASIGPLDGLVNCAGVMHVRCVSTWRWEDARDLLAIDLLAPLRLQALVVPGMVERRRGLIVNIASMIGPVPMRGCTYYGAAKSGLGTASEIARAELARHGICVITVYPGPVRSQLEAGARADFGGGGVFGKIAPTGKPDTLARRIMTAIEKDEARVIYPRLYSVGRLAPNLTHWLALSYGPPPVA